MNHYLILHDGKVYQGSYSNILAAHDALSKVVNQNISVRVITTIFSGKKFSLKVVSQNESYYDKAGVFVEDVRKVDKFFEDEHGQYLSVFGEYVKISNLNSF